MQATTRLHDGIANPVLQETYLVVHNSVAFHPANRVFNTDADGRDQAIRCVLQGGEFSTRGFFLGLADGHPIASIPLEPHILIETTAVWEGLALQIGQAFVVCLPVVGGTEAAEMTGRIDPEEGVDRVTRLLATVVVLLV